MNNEELKKKIVEVIDNWADNAVKTKRSGASVYDPYNAAELADALIAAQIGDVSGLKNHRLIAEYSLISEDGNSYVLPNTPLRVKQLYSGEEVERIAKERDEYKHRAEVAERALQIADELGELCGRKEDYVQQAEKELAEEGKDD